MIKEIIIRVISGLIIMAIVILAIFLLFKYLIIPTITSGLPTFIRNTIRL